MAKIYSVIQIKLNHAVKKMSMTYQQSVFQRMTNISESFTYKMAATINWHRRGTKLRHCHPMYTPVTSSTAERVIHHLRRHGQFQLLMARYDSHWLDQMVVSLC